ncbi:MAG: hypothetical protein AB7E29_08365 [Xanthobacter sp.]
MSTDGERLVFLLEARIKDFEKNLAKGKNSANKNLRDIEKRTETMAARMKASLAKAGAGFNAGMGLLGIGGIAAGAGLAGVVASVRNVTSSIADMAAEAKKAGVGVEAFQELSYAAQQARVGPDALADGLKELQIRADEFILTGAGGGAEAFQRLGFSAEELKEKLEQPDVLFEEIIDKLKLLDTASQIRIADEIFGGTGGEQFVRFLESGQRSIVDMRREARDLGIVMDAEMVKSAEDLDRKFNTLAATVEARLKGAIVSVAEAFDSWATSVQQFLTDLGNHGIWKKLEAGGNGTALGRLLNTGVEQPTLLKDEAGKPKTGNDIDSLLDGVTSGLAQIEAQAAARKQAAIDPASNKPKKTTGGSKTTPGQRFEASIDSMREEIRWLELEQAALGKSTYETEKLRAGQKLLDDARRAGVAVSPEIQAQINAEAEAYAQAAAKLEDAGEAMARADELRGYLGSKMSAGISDLITGARTLDDVVKDLTSSLMDAVLQATLLGEGPLGSIMGGQGLLGGGGGSGSGGGGLIGQLIGGVAGAFTGGAGGSIGLYDQGGYTGDGGKHDPAGIVHRGEYVFDKAATARLGAGNLEALRRGKSLPGFASGGAVGIPATLKAPPSMAGATSGGTAQTNNVTVSPTYNITTSGGDKDNAGLKEALAQSNIDIERMMKAILIEDIRKMGPITSANQQRFGLNPARGIG